MHWPLTEFESGSLRGHSLAIDSRLISLSVFEFGSVTSSRSAARYIPPLLQEELTSTTARVGSA